MSDTNSSFTGKVAFITGAASGIGRATAIAFGREGAQVLVADISGDGAEAVAQAVEQAGGKALAVPCDVSKEEEVRAALDRAVQAFGGIDYAFNNAGVEQDNVPLTDVSVETFDRLMSIDLRGVFLCMKYEIPLLVRRGGGVIVNTSSGAGVTAIKNQAVYTAAKFGVTSMSKAVALECADKNIRVNAICPGIIDTAMMDRVTGDTNEGREKVVAQEPVGRMGKPEEIAAAVLFLCSDQAKFITGHAMVVDGGQTAGMGG